MSFNPVLLAVTIVMFCDGAVAGMNRNDKRGARSVSEIWNGHGVKIAQ